MAAKLREMNKKRCKNAIRARNAEVEVKRSKKRIKHLEKIMAGANAQIAAFRTEHPDWEPPDKVFVLWLTHHVCTMCVVATFG